MDVRPVMCPFCHSTFAVPADPLAAECLWCHKPLPLGQTRLYCDNNCYMHAYRSRPTGDAPPAQTKRRRLVR